ncbi:MAG: 16S rRNA pseudouridine(516) synthase [Candidatus Onthomonas sp.]
MDILLRVDKLLADTGRWSRKDARELLRQGRVICNGVVVRRGDCKARPEVDDIRVDGQPVGWSAHCYLMLNKPVGYLSATEDRNTPTVLDLVPPELRRPGLAPVGRLDKDTTGLLLLTDDGQLAHDLLSPRRHVDKVYLARVEGTGSEADCFAFQEGIVLGDGTKCLPAQLELLEPGLCRVIVREGKFHQVKRMLASRGLPVLALERRSMGPLELDDRLAPGQLRPLTPEELEALRSC